MQIIRNKSAKAFTRTDLVMVVAFISLIALLVAPTNGAFNSQASESMRCQGNLRQLITAWHLYAADHDGLLPRNLHGAILSAAANNNPDTWNWARGWMDWGIDSGNTNTLFLTQSRNALLATYLKGDAKIFKCPSDRYISRPQASRKWTGGRARTYVMNATVGPGNAQTGPWDARYKQAAKLSDILNLRQIYVFLEEHPDSINDTLFFPPQSGRLVDYPASFHDGGGNFAFADGSVRHHRWKSNLRNLPVKFNFTGLTPSAPNSPDVLWLIEGAVRSR